MTVNMHDEAYALEKAIRNSNEYNDLKEMYEAVTGDDIARKTFDNFRTIQIQLQQKQMMGQEVSQEEVDQAQKTFELVQQNEKIGKLMEAEQRMSVVVTELNKIIMKPLEELYAPANNN